MVNECTKINSKNVIVSNSRNLRYLFSKIRHKDTSSTDFAFYANRVMTIVAEDALSLVTVKGTGLKETIWIWVKSGFRQLWERLSVFQNNGTFPSRIIFHKFGHLKVIHRGRHTYGAGARASFNRYRRKRPKNGREYFRLGSKSYSSLGRVGKKKKIACPLLDVFACGQVSSPRLYRLSFNLYFLVLS